MGPKRTESHEDRQLGPISRESVDEVLALLMPIHPWWVAITVAAAVASVLQVSRNAEGHFEFNGRFATITALLLALAWLPALLKILAVCGFGAKLMGNEVSTGGLLPLLSQMSDDARRATLPSALAAAQTAEAAAPAELKQQARTIRKGMEHLMSNLPPASSDAAKARAEVSAMAKRYEQVRAELEPGPRRTAVMSTLVGQAMTLARQAGFTAVELHDFFRSDSDGCRVAALAMMRVEPRPSCFDIVLEAIGTSHSAFEQYQALLIAEAMLSDLDSTQRQQLADVLRDQRSGKPGKWITPRAADRWAISCQLLDELDTR